MKHFLPAFFLSTLLLGLSACQNKPAALPDAAQNTLVKELLAAADTLPSEAIPALIQSLSPMWVDSFYMAYLEAAGDQINIPRLLQGVAQYQTLRPGDAEVTGLANLYQGRAHQWSGRYDSAEVFYARAAQHYERVGNNKSLIGTLSSRAGNFSMMGHPSRDIAIKYQVLAIAQKINDSVEINRTRVILANSLSQQGKADQALEMMTGLESYFAVQKDSMAWSYMKMVEGQALMKKKQYEQSVQSFGKCLALRRQASGIPSSMVLEGLYLYGRSLNRVNRFQEALDTLRVAERMNAANPNKQLTAILYYCIGESLMKTGHLAEAEEYGQKSLEICLPRKDAKNSAQARDLLYQINKSQGDIPDALFNHEELMVLRDSTWSTEKKKVIEELEVKYETREKEQQIAALQKESALATQRNGWIGGSLLLLAMFGLFFVRQRARRKQEQLEKTLELQRIELESNQILLNDYTQMLIERNSRVEALAQQQGAKHLSSDQSDSPGTDRAATEQLYQAIIEDTDWEQFQQRFSKAYPGFIPEISQQMPSLTAGELRLLMLAKMGLSLKQSAVLLGIETNSVKTGRYRLRKKLQEVGAELAGLLADG